MASDLGLQKVGWIFTDLVADDVRKGTVKHLRDINTHFLTAEECILAGHLQNQHPSPCKLSASGKFGSKFSTVVVSGLFALLVQYPLYLPYSNLFPHVHTYLCSFQSTIIF